MPSSSETETVLDSTSSLVPQFSSNKALWYQVLIHKQCASLIYTDFSKQRQVEDAQIDIHINFQQIYMVSLQLSWALTQ